MPLFSPASVDEAHALLSAAPLTVDSPTQRRHRTDAHLRDALEAGRRRPAWTWALRDDTGAVLGVVAALGPPHGSDVPFVLDFFGLPDDAPLAAELVAHASDAVRALGVEEACLFAPSGAAFEDAAVAPVVGPLRAAGWGLLVERRHYEFEADPAMLLTEPGPGLRFEQLTDPADPRLRAVHREVMRETLDAHDAATVARVGFDAACDESLAFLLESDPVECLHLAIDESTGDVVGMASILTTPTGRGFVLFVGVAHAHRGHGYGRRILAWQTRQLLTAGSTTLIADTDNTNVPMAKAFADAGWPQTETRIDLV